MTASIGLEWFGKLGRLGHATPNRNCDCVYYTGISFIFCANAHRHCAQLKEQKIGAGVILRRHLA